jgi:hypothetical protein
MGKKEEEIRDKERERKEIGWWTARHVGPSDTQRVREPEAAFVPSLWLF